MNDDVFTKIFDRIREEQLIGFAEVTEAIASSEVDNEFIGRLKLARDKHHESGLTRDESDSLNELLEHVLSARNPYLVLLASKRLHTLNSKFWLLPPKLLPPLVESVENIASSDWSGMNSESEESDIARMALIELARIALINRDLQRAKDYYKKSGVNDQSLKPIDHAIPVIDSDNLPLFSYENLSNLLSTANPRPKPKSNTEIQFEKDYLYLILAGIKDAGLQLYTETLSIEEADVITQLGRYRSGWGQSMTPNSIAINAIRNSRGSTDLKSGRYTIYKFLRENQYPDLKTDVDGQCLVMTSEKEKMVIYTSNTGFRRSIDYCQLMGYFNLGFAYLRSVPSNKNGKLMHRICVNWLRMGPVIFHFLEQKNLINGYPLARKIVDRREAQ